MTLRRCAWAAGSIALLTAAAAPCAAQAPEASPEDDSGAPTLIDMRPRGLTVRARGDGRHAFAAALNDASGDVSVSRAGTSLSVGVPAGEKTRLHFGARDEVSFYDFDSPTLLPEGGDPLETTNQLDLNARYQRGFGRGWAVIAGGGARFSREIDADFSDAVTGHGVAIITRYLSRNAQIGLGAAVSSRLEDSPQVLPVAVIDWLITPRLRLRNSGSAGGTAGIELSYEVRENLSLALDTGFERREYRLDDDGPIPGGVARDRRIPVALSLRVGDPRRVRFEVRGGVYPWQEFELLDGEGNEVAESDANPTGFIGAGLSIAF